FLCEIGQVNSEMAPPCAVVVPEVMIGIPGPGPDCEFELFRHTMRVLLRPRIRWDLKTQKPSGVAQRHQWSISFGNDRFPHIRRCVRYGEKHLNYSCQVAGFEQSSNHSDAADRNSKNAQ